MRQYLRIRGALDAEQLRACNAVIGAKLAADADPHSLTHRFHSTHGGVEAISASQSESSEGPNGLLDWGPPFLGLVDNAAVLPKMVDMLSLERFGHVHPDCPPGRAREIRLDHDYLNVMRYDGSAGGTYSESGTSQLHSAGQSALHATMVYELADVPENAGGLCADPPSRATTHNPTTTPEVLPQQRRLSSPPPRPNRPPSTPIPSPWASACPSPSSPAPPSPGPPTGPAS